MSNSAPNWADTTLARGWMTKHAHWRCGHRRKEKACRINRHIGFHFHMWKHPDTKISILRGELNAKEFNSIWHCTNAPLDLAPPLDTRYRALFRDDENTRLKAQVSRKRSRSNNTQLVIYLIIKNIFLKHRLWTANYILG